MMTSCSPEMITTPPPSNFIASATHDDHSKLGIKPSTSTVFHQRITKRIISRQTGGQHEPPGRKTHQQNVLLQTTTIPRTPVLELGGLSNLCKKEGADEEKAKQVPLKASLLVQPPWSAQAKLLSPSSCSSGSTGGTEKWNKRYQELLAFKKEFGHCKVQRKQKRYNSLQSWIGKQREA